MAEYFKKDGDDFVEVKENLLTQTDVDNVIEKRLERERSKFADYDSLKEKASKVDDISKEYEDKIKAIGSEKSELEKQLQGAKLETDKVKIIHEYKLSDELAEFVTGDSVDDMKKKAEKLSKGIKITGPNIDKNQKPEDKTSDAKALASKLFTKKSDD